MSPQFVTRPPSRRRFRWTMSWISRMGSSLLRIIWQVFTAFEEIKKPDPIPRPRIELSEEQIGQCLWIFNQAEPRRNQLEQKAQWTFGLIAFLVPVIGSSSVFLVKLSTTATTSQTIAVSLLALSLVVVFLGFVSAMRAIFIGPRETLFLGSAIHLNDGQFRKYSKQFHARGLLYCASVNTATNDHVAQFVKGAHTLTVISVIASLAATIPASIAFSDQFTPPLRAKVDGVVATSSAEILTLDSHITKLREDIASLSDTKASTDSLKPIEARLESVEVSLKDVKQKRTHATACK